MWTKIGSHGEFDQIQKVKDGKETGCMLKNTDELYGSGTKWFHWLIAILVIGLLTVGIIMTNIGNSPSKWELYGLHKATGFVVFWLVLARLIWRFINKVPQLPSGLPKWQAIAADLNMKFLYLSLIVMPLSGMMLSLFGGHPISIYGLFTIPAISQKSAIAPIADDVHVVLAYVFLAAILLHIAAAFYHHFVLRDNVLKRML